MLDYIKSRAGRGVIPITLLCTADLDGWVKAQPQAVAKWVKSTRFAAKPGETLLIAGTDGAVERALAGFGAQSPVTASVWDWAALPGALPEAAYRIDAELDADTTGRAALGWALATYRYDRYRATATARRFPTLVWPRGCDRAAVEGAARAIFLARDLINTPASDMGPQHLAAASRKLAREHGGRCRVISGSALIRDNYPAIHAMGRASSRGPCLIDLRWGKPRAPAVTLVGKGVCFDTGGLDLKPTSGMKLMKKDMGGAANVLGLASMIMAAALPVRLRVLIPAIENSVSGDAVRPLDVVPTRLGLSVEIGNTDAEGRVILADALTEAARDKPALLIDCATLTGAARVALGTDIPALFCNDESLAADLLALGEAQSDPLWRLPLWQPYRKHIESKVADIANVAEISYAGAITAALFLEEFVEPGTAWAHIDLMAWNTAPRPGRPEGGEAQGIRALFALIKDRFGA